MLVIMENFAIFQLEKSKIFIKIDKISIVSKNLKTIAFLIRLISHRLSYKTFFLIK